MAGGVVVAIVAYLLAENVMRKAERDEINHDTAAQPPLPKPREFSILHHRK